MQLTCPNCGGTMRMNERSGADECVNCQWRFVGRVELEALLAVKARYEQPRAPLETVDAPLYEALAAGADYPAPYRPEYRPEYRTEYRPEYRTEYRPQYRTEYRADSPVSYRPEYRTEYRVDYPPDYRMDYQVRDGRPYGTEVGRPPGRPNLRVVPSLPPEKPPETPPVWFTDRLPAAVGEPSRQAPVESWFEQPARRLEAVRPIQRGRHRRESFLPEAFD
jgi:Zn-finger nucleic acid-binding protein